MENTSNEHKTLIGKVKRNYQGKAEKIAKSKEKTHELLERVGSKIHLLADNPTVKEAKMYLDVVVRMIRAYQRNEYRAFSSKSLILLVVGLLYFVMPFDIIPDFIAGLGYVDDLSVLLAITKSMQSDIEAFLDWERTKV